MKPHIELLTELENQSTTWFKWDRVNESTIVISTSGYKHQELNEAEEQLLKAGCRYDFVRGVQEFDKVCGRTFTFLREPK
jgi:hypothetical protein